MQRLSDKRLGDITVQDLRTRFAFSPDRNIYEDSPKSMKVAFWLAILAGGWGIHNFYIGNYTRGAAQVLILLFTTFLFWPAWIICWLWPITEAIRIHRGDGVDGNGRRIISRLSRSHSDNLY